jgi:CheY-like chemotaxis protein
LGKVLVIDSDSYTRAQLRTVLEEGGHEVDEASNGRSGLAKVSSSPVDLVTTCMVMPEMDGLETIRAFKRGYPDVKIVVVSGYDQNGDLGLLSLARELGASGTLKKPIDRQELLQTVDELIGIEN